MTTNFIPALLELKEVDPAELVGKLYKVFNAIGGLSAQEVVAAYQATRLCAQTRGLMDDPGVKALLEALVAQMANLCYKLKTDPRGAEDLAQRFSKIVGGKIGFDSAFGSR